MSAVQMQSSKKPNRRAAPSKRIEVTSFQETNEERRSEYRRLMAEHAQRESEAAIRQNRATGMQIALFERDLKNIFAKCAGGNAMSDDISSFKIGVEFGTFMSGANAAYLEQQGERLPYAETCHVHIVRSTMFPDRAIIGSYISHDIEDLKKTFQMLNPSGSTEHVLAPVATSMLAFNSFGRALVARGIQKLDLEKIEALQGFPNTKFPKRYYTDVLSQLAIRPLNPCVH